MPTAPKLVAAVFFGFLAWFTAGLIIPYFPEGTQVAWFGEGCAAIGIACGWRMSGTRAGTGLRSGLGYGLTTVALIVVWGLFIFAAEEMLDRSLNVRYGGPMEALSDMIGLMVENAQLVFKPDVIITLLVGALVGGWLTERSARAWT